MKHVLSTAIILFALEFSSPAQDTVAMRFANMVKAEEMKKHLTVLASDEYEGRETGQKGQKMAAEYIRNFFSECGIPPNEKLNEGYFQQFPIQIYQPQECNLVLDKKSLINLKDYFTWSSIIKDTSIQINQIRFCGYGINTFEYNDFDKPLKNDEAILILDGEPFDQSGKSIISKTESPSEWTTNYRMKQNEFKKQGVKIVFVVVKNLNGYYQKNEHRITGYKMSTDGKGNTNWPLVIGISEETANLILNKKKTDVAALEKQISSKRKSVSVKCGVNFQISVKQKRLENVSENVLGYIEGSDLKDELLVVTAHYDHLGIHDGVVFNGADDDGSGTVTVMNLAKAFNEAKKAGRGPRRSILFMTVSGEEKGLLGSEYYSKHPVFPMENTIANLNIDMVGRIDKKHSNGNYVYIIGSNMLSSELHDINEKANAEYTKLELDYTYNSTSDPNRYYYRSDHYNFAKNKVPVIFYFNGVHEDYHQETDEVQKIDFIKMQQIGRLVFYTTWELANRNERIKVDKVEKD